MNAQMTCPQCAATIEVDDRWVKWCEHCEWNLEPSKDEPTGKSQRSDEAGRRRHQRLFDDVRRSTVLKPRRSGEQGVALLIAIAIHTVTFVILALGIYVLAANFPCGFGSVGGGFLLLLALLTRPRLGGV